ncbi:MAG: APC family permease [Gemmatimonadaceae bacterium]|nr:APC family permease [Gemmatimonadaceae bacterium]
MTEAAATPAFRRDVSLLGVVALCVGNMVGTSIYTLPAAMASKAGPAGLLAWALTAAGYAFVAIVYAALGARMPQTGGPYIFAREAFGDFGGFIVVWSYWISALIGNAAIVTSAIAYATGFSTAFGASPLMQFAVAQLLVWGLCWLNIRGVRFGTRLQIVLMFLTIIPLLIVSVMALGEFDVQRLQPFAPQGYGAIAAAAALVVWAYSGVESGTVPAEEIQDGGRTIKRGTIIGYVVATIIFLSSALAVAGALPNGEIAVSNRPIALAAERTAGTAAGVIIGATAIVAALATLNGWILMAGRIPVTAADDGLLPRGLARLHPRYGTPHIALVVAAAVPSALLLMYFSRSLLQVFEFIVLLAVLTTLVPHLFAMCAEFYLVRKHPERFTDGDRRRAYVVAPLAFAFLLFALYGAGGDVAMWGVITLLLGLPVYAWMRTDSVGASS